MIFSARTPSSVAANDIATALAEAKRRGEVLDLSSSNPTTLGMSLPRETLLRALDDGRNSVYVPDPRGLPSARQAVSERYSGAVPSERVFLTASTSEGYAWLFKLLCDPGDVVLVPKPGYPLFDYLAGLECVETTPYELEYRHPSGWSIDFDSLEAGLAAGGVKAVVVIHPNNPTGSYVAEGERGELVRLCSRYGAAIIADEVFRTHSLRASPEPSFAGETRVPTFVLDGLSKCLGLPQLKAGWILVSGPAGFEAEAVQRLEIIADTYLSASTPAMNALPALLSSEESVAKAIRGRALRNLDVLEGAFSAAGGDGHPSPYRVLACHAGWTALLEYPRVVSEEELVLALVREDGVYLHPGFFFDLRGEGVLSFSLIVPEENFAKAVRLVRTRIDGYL